MFQKIKNLREFEKKIFTQKKVSTKNIIQNILILNGEKITIVIKSI